MNDKPSTRDGYSSEDLVTVTQTCLYVFTHLGDMIDDIAVVGGLAPYLLVNQDDLPLGLEPHVGTMDLDLGLSVAIFDEEHYQNLTGRLREAGFGPETNPGGNPRLQTWTNKAERSATIDFLIGQQLEGEKLGAICHIESDFAAFITRGLDLAFRDRRLVELSGYTLRGERTARDIPVCGPGAFIVLKALAFENRGSPKDAYDLHHVLGGLGINDVAQSLVSLLPDARVEDALGVLRNSFTEHDATGPMRVAHFLTGGPEDDIQADVVGNVLELLRSVRGLTS